MAGNSNLHMSRAGKTDEFYTQLSTIEETSCGTTVNISKVRSSSATQMTRQLERTGKTTLATVWAVTPAISFATSS